MFFEFVDKAKNKKLQLTGSLKVNLNDFVGLDRAWRISKDLPITIAGSKTWPVLSIEIYTNILKIQCGNKQYKKDSKGDWDEDNEEMQEPSESEESSFEEKEKDSLRKKLTRRPSLSLIKSQKESPKPSPTHERVRSKTERGDRSFSEDRGRASSVGSNFLNKLEESIGSASRSRSRSNSRSVTSPQSLHSSPTKFNSSSIPNSSVTSHSSPPTPTKISATSSLSSLKNSVASSLGLFSPSSISSSSPAPTMTTPVVPSPSSVLHSTPTFSSALHPVISEGQVTVTEIPVAASEEVSRSSMEKRRESSDRWLRVSVDDYSEKSEDNEVEFLKSELGKFIEKETKMTKEVQDLTSSFKSVREERDLLKSDWEIMFENSQKLRAKKKELKKKISELQAEIKKQSVSTVEVLSISPEPSFSEVPARISELENHMSEKAQIIKTLESEVSQLKATLSALEKENVDLNSQLKSKSEEFRSREALCSEALEATSKYQAEITKLKEENSRLVSDHDALESLMSQIKSAATQYQFEISELKMKNLEMRSEEAQSRSALDSEISQLKKEKSELKSEIARSGANFDSEIAKLKKENSDLKSQISRSNKTLDSQLSELEKENSELKLSASQFSEEIAELKEANAKLLATARSQSDLDAENLSLKSIISKNSEEITELKKAAIVASHSQSVIDAENLSLKSTVAKYSAEIAELKKAITVASSSQSILDAENSSLKSLVSQYSEEIAEMKKTNAAASSSQSALNTEISNLKSTVSQYSEEIAELKKANVAASSSQAILNTENSNLKSLISQYTEEIAELKKTNTDASSSQSALNTEILNLKSLVSQYSEEIAELKKTNTDASSSHSALNTEILNLKSTLSSCHQTISELEKANEQLMAKKPEESEGVAKLQEDILQLQKANEQLSAELSGCKETISSLNSKVAELQSELDKESDSENANIKRHLETTNANLLAQSATLQVELQKMKRAHESAISENQTLTMDLSNLGNSNAKLEKLNADLKSTLDEKNDEILKQQENVHNLENVVTQLREKTADFERTKIELTTKILHLEEKNGNLLSDIAQVRENFEEQKTINSEIIRTRAQLERKNIELEKVKLEVNKECEDLRAERKGLLLQLTTGNVALGQQVNEYLTEIEKLKSKIEEEKNRREASKNDTNSQIEGLIREKDRLLRDCKKYEEVKQEMERDIQRLEAHESSLEKELSTARDEISKLVEAHSIEIQKLQRRGTISTLRIQKLKGRRKEMKGQLKIAKDKHKQTLEALEASRAALEKCHASEEQLRKTLNERADGDEVNRLHNELDMQEGRIFVQAIVVEIISNMSSVNAVVENENGIDLKTCRLLEEIFKSDFFFGDETYTHLSEISRNLYRQALRVLSHTELAYWLRQIGHMIDEIVRVYPDSNVIGKVLEKDGICVFPRNPEVDEFSIPRRFFSEIYDILLDVYKNFIEIVMAKLERKLVPCFFAKEDTGYDVPVFPKRSADHLIGEEPKSPGEKIKTWDGGPVHQKFSAVILGGFTKILAHLQKWRNRDSIILQFFHQICYFMDTTLFNCILMYPTWYCSADIGIHIKLLLSQLDDWKYEKLVEIPQLSLRKIGIMPLLTQTANLLLLNKSIAQDLQLLSTILPLLSVNHIYYLLENFRPTSLSTSPVPATLLTKLHEAGAKQTDDPTTLFC
eukprot:TRINITY_DN4460_c0_g2_i2.p1 TRINITY_DN4460_c0_g2~~TRINITY_DN4460_c0_g2_i2.p1  ORF type:complete len:1676 (-),score=431.43 TRINITY_DN4460_c0_g2_i2:74-5101(-)